MIHVKNLIIGIIIGIAGIIPGVSAGMMAVVLGVYHQLINAVGSLRRNWRENLSFLAMMGIGAMIGIWLFSGAIGWMMEHYASATSFLFIGFVLGSLPLIFRKATKTEFRVRNLIPFLGAIAVMLIIFFVSPHDSGTVTRTLTPGVFIQLMLFSAISAAAMMIPGFSGSVVMMMLGCYATVLTAIYELNIPIILPVGLGVLLGIIGCAKVMRWLFARFPQGIYFGILGFMLGSIPAMLPTELGSSSADWWSLLSFPLGVFISWFFASDWLNDRFAPKPAPTDE